MVPGVPMQVAVIDESASTAEPAAPALCVPNEALVALNEQLAMTVSDRLMFDTSVFCAKTDEDANIAPAARRLDKSLLFMPALL